MGVTLLKVSILLPPVSGSVSDSKTEEGECDFVVTEHSVVSESEE